MQPPSVRLSPVAPLHNPETLAGQSTCCPLTVVPIPEPWVSVPLPGPPLSSPWQLLHLLSALSAPGKSQSSFSGNPGGTLCKPLQRPSRTVPSARRFCCPVKPWTAPGGAYSELGTGHGPEYMTFVRPWPICGTVHCGSLDLHSVGAHWVPDGGDEV